MITPRDVLIARAIEAGVASDEHEIARLERELGDDVAALLGLDDVDLDWIRILAATNDPDRDPDEDTAEIDIDDYRDEDHHTRCGDCNGSGYYYPLVGPREYCQRCDGSGWT